MKNIKIVKDTDDHVKTINDIKNDNKNFYGIIISEIDEMSVIKNKYLILKTINKKINLLDVNFELCDTIKTEKEFENSIDESYVFDNISEAINWLSIK